MNNHRTASKLGSKKLITAAVVLIAAGAIFATGQSILSPGPLSAQAATNTPLGGISSHAQLSRQCGACHAPPWSSETMAQRCLACHASVAAELQTGGTLHGMLLPPGSNPTCKEGCHVEHRGAAANLTALGSEHSPLNNLGFSLNAHQTGTNGQPFTCLDCHQSGLGKFDKQVCNNCHRDIDAGFAQAHLDAFGTGCLGCHDGIDTYGKAWDHNTADFKLSGKHPSLDCGQCHKGAKNMSQLKAAPQVCDNCHQKDDTHQGTFGQDCSQCHDTNDWKNATIDHAKTSFPLTGKHVNLDCKQCHINGVFKGTPATCYACHQKDDKHAGSYGQDCAQCHSVSDWAQATIDHSKIAYPLIGKHITVDCLSCHLNKVFKGTPATCYACHQQKDTHRGSLGQNCAECHNTNGWTPATYNRPHRFPVSHENRGRASSCSICHPTSLLKYTCYGCHEHTVANILGKHRNTQNLEDCVRCHADGREYS